jgi:tetratricopeptide (TPR) repeat protein
MRAFLLTLALVSSSLPVAAQPLDGERAPTDSERAAAQVLFDAGRELLTAERYAEACPKFAESLRLDQAIGTQMNLALCYERLGRVASAWINYAEAATRSSRAGQEERAAVARERANALLPLVPKLRVVVQEPVPGLSILRDGVEMGAPQWDTPVPVDPGERAIEVRAPGKKTWKTTVEIPESPEEVVLEIPPLDDAPIDPDPRPNVQRVEVETPQEQRIAAYTLGSLGVAGLVIGGAFGGLAISRNEESQAFCPDDPNRCRAEGVALRDQALTFAHVSTAGLAAGGALLVTGVILLLTAPDAPSEATEVAPEVSLGPLGPSPGVVPTSLGATVRGRF